MFVTVRYRPDDNNGQQADVSGIHQSAEQAARVANQDSARKTAAFEWPNRHPPSLGETVGIVDGQILPHRRPGLLDLLDMALKRQELTDLRRQNEALAQHNTHLQIQLNPKHKVYHARLHRERRAARSDLRCSRGARGQHCGEVAGFR